ncbi:D-aminoacyl-tRNA deacylase [Chrysoperla carnea]|uniref:D-aminoacyl-tRNA deacylase n=1 Tax=Chrysoperla carnea TaxID=189513 RepID=UPI001D07F36E|nr:D-aminoacyl-tRNA deacylase [Chrysoperla carnea]
MKLVIQRVAEASVSVDSQLISKIGKGLCVLVGISKYDTHEDMKYLVRKLLNARLFDNEKKWNASVKDKQYEILCISQFTLCYQFKSNKLTFHRAMETEKSKEMYGNFLSELRNQYDSSKIFDGVFGAYMDVCIKNDGPVTITIDSPSESKKPDEEINQS